MRVGADREQLGRHRAGLAADRHVRDDRRDVGPERAGVDEFAAEQSLDVRPAARDAPSRPQSGSRRSSSRRSRPGSRRATSARSATPSPSSWRPRTAAARPAPPRTRSARRRSSSRAGRVPPAQSARRPARAARPRAWSRTRRRARRSWSGRPGRPPPRAARRPTPPRRPTRPAGATPRTVRMRSAHARPRRQPLPWCWRRRCRARRPQAAGAGSASPATVVKRGRPRQKESVTPGSSLPPWSRRTARVFNGGHLEWGGAGRRRAAARGACVTRHLVLAGQAVPCYACHTCVVRQGHAHRAQLSTYAGTWLTPRPSSGRSSPPAPPRPHRHPDHPLQMPAVKSPVVPPPPRTTAVSR